jgi:hypothetical protein
MLAGVPPFIDLPPMELAWAHQHAPVPDVRVARPDTPPGLAATISKALAKDPADRFATADAMRRALTRPSVPAAAPPPTNVFSAPVLPPTVIGPAPATVGGGPPRPRRPWRWAVALGVLLALVAGAIALAISRRDGGSDQQGSTTDGPTTVASTTPPSTTTPPTTTTPPATTTPPSTAPPSTVAQTTTPATTSPPTSELPIVPILPDSLPSLVAALALDPGFYGERSADLADELAEVDGRPDRARRVLERAEAWVEDGELSPAVLPLLHVMLDGLANSDDGATGNGNGGDEG